MNFSTKFKTTQFERIKERLSNPFPGLRPFGIDEAYLFFGREGQSDEILLKLAQNRFAALLGFSGSGKSSLISCGLVPILYGGFMTEAGADWRIVMMRPGTNPIDNLAEALVIGSEKYEQSSKEEQVIRKTVLATILRSSSLGLIEAVRYLRTSKKENILIIVDQFEEIFRYKRLEEKNIHIDETSLFVSLLLEAVRRHQEPIYVTLTMRSDFIGDCAIFPELTQMINDSHYLIPQMNREQKRMAIEGPVAVGGGKIAPRLVQQLLNDVGESPDQLPILQHALMRTWQYWKAHHKQGEPMDLRHYNAVGAFKEALSQHANEAYDSLNKRDQRICEIMFKALAERGSENQLIRRPTRLGEISAIAGVSDSDLIRVVDRFREPGRTLLMPPHDIAINADTVIDISHESLMRIWTRLKTWLEEEGRSAYMYLKLAEAANRYQKGEASLWKMPDLQLALNWKEENKPTLLWGKRYHPAYERTMVFLENSRRTYENEQSNKELLQKRKIRIRNILVLISAFIVVVCIFLVYLAQTKTAEAENSAEEARLSALKAEKAAEDAKKAEQKAVDQQKIAEQQRLVAVQAQKRADENAKKAEQSAIEAKSSAARAIEQQKIAEQQRLVAVQAQKRADENAKKAEQNAIAATQNAARADSLRFQAIAQSMASRVEDLRNVQQKGLIAMQAHLFYDKYGDKLYNADIYDGVYNAYKSILGDSVNYYNIHKGSIRALAFSPDGRRLYSSASDSKIYTWNMSGGQISPTLLYDVEETNAIPRILRPIREGKQLVVAGEMQNIYIINSSDGSLTKTLSSSSPIIYDMVILPDENEFVCIGSNRTLVRGSLRQNGKFQTIGQFDSKPKSISLSSDGYTLASSDEQGNVLLWDLRNGTNRTIYASGKNAYEAPINALRFSHSGKILAFGDETGEVILWDMKENIILTDLSAHYSRVSDIQFSQDDALMLTTSRDKTAKIWDLNYINDLPIVLKDYSDWVWTAVFSPDTKQVVTASGDHVLRVYPTQVDSMVDILCTSAKRNMTQNEWARFVGEDVAYGITCSNYPEEE